MRYIIGALLFGIVTTFTMLPNHSPNTKPNTIITLSPAHSQFFKYLDLLDNVIAVSSYDQEVLVQNKHKIHGGVVVPEEDILRLNPSLVIIGDIQGNTSFSKFLDSYNIAHRTFKTKSIQDIHNSLVQLSELFPTEKNKLAVSTYQQELAELLNNSPVKKRKALVILSIDPIYTISTNDFLSEVFNHSGWNSVVQSQIDYPILTEEDILSIKDVDDIIIMPLLTNEMAYIEDIQDQIKAKNIVVISNSQSTLPSPYILDTIRDLRQIHQNL